MPNFFESAGPALSGTALGLDSAMGNLQKAARDQRERPAFEARSALDVAVSQEGLAKVQAEKQERERREETINVADFIKENPMRQEWVNASPATGKDLTGRTHITRGDYEDLVKHIMSNPTLMKQGVMNQKNTISAEDLEYSRALSSVENKIKEAQAKTVSQDPDDAIINKDKNQKILTELQAKRAQIEEMRNPIKERMTQLQSFEQQADVFQWAKEYSTMSADQKQKSAHLQSQGKPWGLAAVEEDEVEFGGGKSSDTQLYATLVNSPKEEDRARAAAMLAFRRAQAVEASDTTLAKRSAEIATAALLESEKARGKVEGGGEVTPKEKKSTAQTRVSDVLDVLKGHYQALNEKSAIANTDNDALSNVSARVRSSGVGQAVGKAVGTEEQSIRNKISQIKPLLIQYIRQASEMGVKGMDSERELAFYLQAATDPSIDIQANIAAIQVLENAYGINPQETKPDAAKTSDSTQKVKPKGKRKQGRDGKWYVNDGKGWRPE